MRKEREHDRIRSHGQQETMDVKTPIPRMTERHRFKYLARHKEPQIAWWTCVGPPQNWGTQEPMSPISREALSANATPRVKNLAMPKKKFLTGMDNRPIWLYGCGRSSTLSLVDSNAKQATASTRVQNLAQHKTYPQHKPNRHEFLYSCGRASPIYHVACKTMNSEFCTQIANLSHHKTLHPKYQSQRNLPWEVSETAKTTKPTERIKELASPKLQEEPIRDPMWHVTKDALSAMASARCKELARAKSLADGFQHARDVQWSVSKAAKCANAPDRLKELATPIQRMNRTILQYNPEAFQVKPLALKAQISVRVTQLAQPIIR